MRGYVTLASGIHIDQERWDDCYYIVPYRLIPKTDEGKKERFTREWLKRFPIISLRDQYEELIKKDSGFAYSIFMKAPPTLRACMTIIIPKGGVLVKTTLLTSWKGVEKEIDWERCEVIRNNY